MGNWDISIQGVGSHGNGMASDAEQLAADFVDKLTAAGHSVTTASVTSGGAVEVKRISTPTKTTEDFRREHPVK